MDKQHPNSDWCRTIADSLLRLGIHHAVVCAGARSAAMVAALRERSAVSLYFQTDERSAGFFALGLHKELRQPVAVCVTSGSAVANLVPALTEAHADRLPLMVISCDRPRRLRPAGLLQVTPQVDFCAPLVRACVDLDDPENSTMARLELSRQIEALMPYLHPGSLRGPVQINVPLLGVSSSVDGDHGWSGQTDETVPPSYAEPQDPTPRADERDVQALAAELKLRPGMRGLIFAGPNATLAPDLVANLARRTGFPLLLDAPGRLRSAGIEGAISEADQLVSWPELARGNVELVIHLGEAPVHHATQAFLAGQKCPTLRIGDHHVEGDAGGAHLAQLLRPTSLALQELGSQLQPGDEAWRRRWQEAAGSCRRRVDEVMRTFGWGEFRAIHAALGRPEFDFVHVANSTPIRQVNLLMPGGTQREVHANRGVSGIDGTLGTFLGELSARGRRGLLVIGDLAMLHDIPALEAARRTGLDGVILVINNHGAGLFDHLQLATLPDYESVYRFPAKVQFPKVAEAFGIDHAHCIDAAGFNLALDRAREQGRLTLIEAEIPRRRSGRTEADQLGNYFDK